MCENKLMNPFVSYQAIIGRLYCIKILMTSIHFWGHGKVLKVKKEVVPRPSQKSN